MGWDFGEEWSRGHEGYVVGFVPKDGAPSILRELGYPDDNERRDGVVVELSAACECGWRSPRFKPWWDQEQRGRRDWSPFIVHASEQDETKARALWREHMKTYAPVGHALLCNCAARDVGGPHRLGCAAA